MKRTKLTALAAAFAAASFSVLPQLAVAESQTIPILKADLQGMEGMVANVIMLDVDPGWQTPNHIHPGQLILYVLEGEAVLDVEGRDTMTVKAGEAIYETPNVPMVGRNISTTDRAKLLVFQVGEADAPIMVAQE